MINAPIQIIDDQEIPVSDGYGVARQCELLSVVSTI